MLYNKNLGHNAQALRRRVHIRSRGALHSGRVLLSLLWNLIADDIFNYTAKYDMGSPGFVQAFADDLVSLAEGYDLDVISDRTRETINDIVNWCHTKELSITALKTKIIVLTRNKKWSLRPMKEEDITVSSRFGTLPSFLA